MKTIEQAVLDCCNCKADSQELWEYCCDKSLAGKYWYLGGIELVTRAINEMSPMERATFGISP